MSDDERLVVELGPNREVVRVGNVLAVSGPIWTVEWPDGSQDRIRLGTAADGRTFEGAPAGSVKHQLILRQSELDPLLRSNPVQVFEAVLGMTGKAMTATELKRTLIEVHFNREEVDRAWKRVSATLAKNNRIAIIGSGQSRRFELKAESVEREAEPRGGESLKAAPGPARGSQSARQPRQGSDGPPRPALGVEGGSPPEKEPESTPPEGPAHRLGESAPNTRPLGATPSRTGLPAGTGPQRAARAEAERGSATRRGSPTQPRSTRSEEPPKAAPAAGPMQPTASAGSTPESQQPLVVARELHRLAHGKDVDEERLSSAVAREHPVIALVCAVLRGTDVGRKQALTAAVMHPLASGAALAALSEETIASAMQRASEHERLSFLALPRKSRSIDSLNPTTLAGAKAANELLSRAASEFSREKKADRNDIARALAWLFDRMVSSPDAGALDLATVVRIGAFDLPDTVRERAELVADALALCVTSLGSEGWQKIAPADRTSVALRATTASVVGARGRLLRAVHRVDPATVTNPTWWKGVTIDDLLAEQSPLGPVLADPSVIARIVRPLYRAALDDASSRRRLMELLGAPLAVAKSADDDDVDHAFARVATGSDGLLMRWLGRLRDDDGRRRLESGVARLSGQLEAAQADAERANAHSRQMEARLHELESRLREAGAASDKLRDSQARQIQIDVMRAYAVLAGLVSRSIREQRADRVLGRVEALAARQGLVTLGSVGEVVAYEPPRHDLVGPPLEAGESVVVRHSGYTWAGPDGEIVLVRAEVESAH